MMTKDFIDFYQKKHDKEHVIQDDHFFYFYKHISIDTENRVFGIFDNNELKYNYAAYFNDPYDTASQFNLNMKDITKSHLESVVNEKISDFEWPSIKAAYEPMLEALAIKMKPEVDKLISDLQINVPITCFNSHPLSILMWSHYAQNHSGFMLEFKIPKDYSSEMMPLPIEYSKEFPTIDLDFKTIKSIAESEEVDFGFLKKLLLHKADCWSYEKEYRVFGTNNPNKENPLLIKFDPKLLSSIITGTRFKDTGKLDLLIQKISDFNIRNDLDVKIYDAKLIDNRYELTVPNHPQLSLENYKGP